MSLLNEALQDYTVALKIDASNPVIYSNRAQVYRKLELFDKAIEDYTSEISCGTGNLVKAHNNRAFCFAKTAKYGEAIEDYSKVLEIDPMNIHALHNRGISFERVGKYQEVGPFLIGF